MAVDAVTQAGRPNRDNQDAFGFNMSNGRLCAAVFDGAVSRAASHIARDLFEGLVAQNPATMLCDVNNCLAMFNLRGGASTGTAFSVTHKIAEMGHVSDSWLMAQFRDKSTELMTIDQHERFDSQALRVMVRVAVEEGIDLSAARQHDRVKQALVTMFETVRNTPDRSGEGILNGSPHMDQYVQTLDENLKVDDIDMLLMGSDGSRFPYCTEQDPAYREELFRLVTRYGAARVVRRIHKDETVKPPTLEHPRWSEHDDKALVALSFRH